MQEPDKVSDAERKPGKRSEFADALQKGLLLGLALLVLVLPPIWVKKQRDAQPEPGQVVIAPQPETSTPSETPLPGPRPPMEPGAQPPIPGVRLADFSGEQPTADARLVANWVVHTRNNKRHAFVIVDKKDARVYVFSPEGKLRDSAPALLGSARGDDTFPGVGNKPIAQVQPHEKTTPAGRFVAEPGLNSGNEDVVWVDYDAAVSMHRIRPTVARERRLERLASLVVDDNRISFGCINLPVSFYENVLSPAVRKHGAIVYVLPEVKTPQQVFGAFDVTDPRQLAAARQAGAARGVQKVALTQPAR